MAKYNPIDLVEPAYKEDFQKFVETGEASEEFLDYLEKDQQAQEAVDIVFDRQAKAFENFAKMLRENENSPLERKLNE